MTSDITGPTGRLHIDDNGSGDGLPVVFVHSFGGSLVHWADQLAHLRWRLAMTYCSRVRFSQSILRPSSA